MIKAFQLVKVIFPDLHVKILDLFEEEGKVAARVAFSGTHSDTYINTKASCKVRKLAAWWKWIQDVHSDNKPPLH